MTIAIKGTKLPANTKGAASRDSYLAKEDAPPKKRFAVAAMILGVTALLKTLFEGWTPAPDAKAAGMDDGEAPPARPDAPASIPQTVPEAGRDAAGSDEAGEVRPLGSGSKVKAPYAPAAYMLVDSPALSVSDYGAAPTAIPFPNLRDLMGAANDNRQAPGAPQAVRPDDGGSPSPTGWNEGPGEPARPDAEEPATSEPELPEMDSDPDDPTPGPAEPGEPDDGDPGEVGPGEVDPDDGEIEEPGRLNRAPRSTGPVALYDIFGCVPVLIALTDLLRNVSDPDGDALSIRNLIVSSGEIVQSGGGWLYDPAGLGPVTVTYEITDGEFSITQLAHFSVAAKPPVSGSDGDDMIVGTPCADTVLGGDGNDNIDGRAGCDAIDGGKGNDHIVGGSGDDILRGDDGHDIILGGEGEDSISGGAGNDRLFGQEGDDTIFGDKGDDSIAGGTGSDMLFGGLGDDVLDGDEGDDMLFGNEGNDRLAGGAGNDTLSGGEANDTISGGAGNDLLLDEAGEDVVDGGAGDDRVVVAHDRDADRYSGGDGTDTLDVSATSGGVQVDLEEGTAMGSEIGANVVDGFEAVIGGTGDDRIHGSAGNDTLLGGAGCDAIDGGAGNDLVKGGAGSDALTDGEGTDVVEGNAGDDVIRVTLDGDDDDRFDGGEGQDTLDCSDATQTIVFDVDLGLACGEEIGSDLFRDIEEVVGGSGDDLFLIGAQSVTLTGGKGDDSFEFAVPESGAAGAVRVAEIVDFGVGDRIRMSKYDIFEKVMDALGDRFEGIYGEDAEKDDALIRYSFESDGDVDRTRIEADIDRDTVFETTILLQGHKSLVIVDQA